MLACRRTAEFLGQKPVEVQHDSNVALPPICLNLSTAGASAYVALARAVLTPKKVRGLNQAVIKCRENRASWMSTTGVDVVGVQK